jgi:SAM-dependent methyltransferase
MGDSVAGSSGLAYLDMQAHVGITKHVGGIQATNELLSRCHVAEAREVLNVGCGIGVTSTYIARRHGCHVVGVDISEKMIEWSRLRASEERVGRQVELRVADIRELPFEADRFDVVVVESVIAFVQDKSRAIRECVRVTRPGGYVGLNESFWAEQPSPELAELVRRELGTEVPTAEAWQSLWAASGLRDRAVTIHRIDPRREVRDRLRWIGPSWGVRALARLFYLYASRPAARASIKAQFGSGMDSVKSLAYGIFTGMK